MRQAVLHALAYTCYVNVSALYQQFEMLSHLVQVDLDWGKVPKSVFGM